MENAGMAKTFANSSRRLEKSTRTLRQGAALQCNPTSPVADNARKMMATLRKCKFERGTADACALPPLSEAHISLDVRRGCRRVQGTPCPAAAFNSANLDRSEPASTLFVQP
jgi:hypothetical protein